MTHELASFDALLSATDVEPTNRRHRRAARRPAARHAAQPKGWAWLMSDPTASVHLAAGVGFLVALGIAIIAVVIFQAVQR